MNKHIFVHTIAKATFYLKKKELHLYKLLISILQIIFKKYQIIASDKKKIKSNLS